MPGMRLADLQVHARTGVGGVHADHVLPVTYAATAGRCLRCMPLPFDLLHRRWVSWQLARSYGLPPREYGMISSISGLSGR